ncbi:uncharacterized protein BDV14DRAFT_181515 [Aspergillus stella-maris]|uniref:uncharacterized protein n=1 Tax=Aspergillus stella-maris TaxID=1810926 RepID=UPI003CCD6590
MRRESILIVVVVGISSDTRHQRAIRCVVQVLRFLANTIVAGLCKTALDAALTRSLVAASQMRPLTSKAGAARLLPPWTRRILGVRFLAVGRCLTLTLIVAVRIGIRTCISLVGRLVGAVSDRCGCGCGILVGPAVFCRGSCCSALVCLHLHFP